ncbi:MAG: acetylornithine transaminase [Deltaproteobacteria bacterium]|nr:MAG: acetylornithine transaminase [Deltaproteobacteria bacterium]
MVHYLMNTYARLPVALVKGKGAWVWDVDGKSYLDMVSGIAVCSLGHCHPDVVNAVSEQARNLFHCSNLYIIPQQEHLAELIVNNSFDGRVFFCNSGAEANEAAIKLARRYCNERKQGAAKIIAMEGSFHGRTLATVAATGQARFRQGFDPIPGGFEIVPYGDIDALLDAIDEDTGAVLLEPIQGESGVHVPPDGYLRQLRKICDEYGLLLILDEVQTGIARTGRFFAYMHEGVEPDIMTMAKALANGFPAGAMLAKPFVADAFTPGSHASTFGGNPLAMSAGIATISTIMRDNIVDKSLQQGMYLMNRLHELERIHPSIKEVRGRGLMIGVDFDADVSSLPSDGLSKGILLNVIKGHTLRLVPPLVISSQEIDQAMDMIDDILKEKGL